MGAQGESERAGDDEVGSYPNTLGYWALYQSCWVPARAVESVKLVQEQFRARHDDMLLVTYPKCGTTWLKALAFAVANRFRHPPTSTGAHPLLAHHPMELVPFLEMPCRRLRPLAQLEELASPRLLATHLPAALLPPSVSTTGCRIVYLCRDPKDALVSLYHFVNKVNDGFTMDKAFKQFCKGETSYGPMWDHILGFWKLRSDTVLFLKYDEMIAQPEKHVKMLAGFLRVPFTDEELSRGVVEDVVRLCSFDNLRTVPANASGVSDRFCGVPVENSSFFRAGKVGDWVNHLTPEMANELDTIVEEKLRGSGLTF